MAANRKALCVGINQFKNYPLAALQGCVNDANEMAALLQKFLGFQSGGIRVLLDAEATKKNIMSGLQEMVEGAKAGKYSYLLFSMSSHGTQVPDLDGDESDHADEAFCPHDLAEADGQWDRNHIITDDELLDLFHQVPSNVLLEVCLDTCHSGTGIRAIDLLLSRRPRYLPPPSLKAFKEVEDKQLRSLGRKLMDKGIVHHILWAACRASQTSADALIAGSWHGAFTYYFCKEMEACGNSLSRAKLTAKVRADLTAESYTQIPQLECDAAKKGAAFGCQKA